MAQDHDRELGMGRRIGRRDFLNGAALGAAGLLLTPRFGYGLSEFAPEKAPDYYPPALTGLRGSHEGSYAAAHALRDGGFWETAGTAEDDPEPYDLVVVGAGISGLAAAHFYRKAQGSSARILILDNHDDFGGHAKRNEFRHSGRLLLGYGGTQSIESPGEYSRDAAGLLRELGVDTRRFYTAYDRGLFKRLGLGTGMFFDRETFGADRLVTGAGTRPWAEFLAEAPLSETARRDIARVFTEKTDYFAGLTRAEKRARLGKLSYADFLTQVVKLSPEVLPFFQTKSHDLWAVGIDALSALTCYESGDDYGIDYPGFAGMDLGTPRDARREPYIFHFPDGNATIARLLVRHLIPAAIPGRDMDDIVTARADYSKLDEPTWPVRLRLNSTVVRVHQQGRVDVEYVRGGRLHHVFARDCVLACWNMMIPYLCPDLPEAQKQALAYNVKAPLVYTHVLIRSWESFARLKLEQVACPGSYYAWIALDFPVSLGGYAFPSRPQEPMVLFLLRTPCQPGLPMKDQYRAGRAELLATSFETFERNIRDQLARALGTGGFDPARDIEAITVNRWPHGYSYSYNSLNDPEWPAGRRPHEIARQRFGRIAIANSDAGASAYTDVAIDQAHRAVAELVAARS